MTYKKRDDVTVESGEQAVELDDGTIIAVRCARSVEGSRLQFSALARVIDAAGAAVKDTSGTAITRSLKHSDSNPSRADDVARDCLLAVLGEAPQTVKWGAQYLLDVSIRQAISLATINPGAADAASLL